MLSVLIPIYNYEVTELVKSLQQQLSNINRDFEVLLLDDGSKEDFKVAHRELNDLPGVSYREEKLNLGRSKIRNKLASMAKFDNLLFLDCDSQIPAEDYIQNYFKCIDNYQVVYGGRIYPEDLPDSDVYKLHWLYGLKREQSPAKVRNEVPNRGFQTNNFMVRKSILLEHPFNEAIKGYGHEDTLFGYDLQKSNLRIQHIDNPVVHMGLEPSEEFLRKTREGIKNLRRIMRINGTERKLVKDITILSFYKRIEKAGLTKTVEFFYNKYEHLLRRNLLSSHPNLLLFDLYKLGYLCSLSNDK